MRAVVHRRPAEASPDLGRLAPTAIRVFEKIADAWSLSSEERRVLLGDIPPSTYFKYKRAPQSAKLSRDTLDRVSHILGIFKAINILLPRKEAADVWLRRSNGAPLFKGRTALEYMLSGGFSAIADVRRYLDAERGW